MYYRLAADFVVVVHAAFVLWVVLGGLVVLRWLKAGWWHLPALAWGVGITLLGGICPLTPLENSLRAAAGQAGYEGGFIQNYFVPIIYPVGSSRVHLLAIGAVIALGNLVIYWLIWRRARRRT